MIAGYFPLPARTGCSFALSREGTGKSRYAFIALSDNGVSGILLLRVFLVNAAAPRETENSREKLQPAISYVCFFVTTT